MTELAERLLSATAVLCAGCTRIVVAVSGGPDSQALLALLGELRLRLGVDLVAVGIDHGLRTEAAAELDLAAALARNLDIPFVRVPVEVTAKGNLQAAARAARYAALRNEATLARAECIALGHTRSDQVETLLHNLVRGCGLRGAGGMRPRRDELIRPLLSVGRDELRTYLRNAGIAWASDPSNEDPHFSRVRIRREVLPVLRTLNPELEASVNRFCHTARLEEDLLASMAHQQLRAARGAFGSLDLEALADLHPALRRRVLRAWLAAEDIPSDAERVDRLLAAIDAGPVATTLGRRRVRSDSGALWIEPAASISSPPQALCVPGGVTLRAADLSIRCRVGPRYRAGTVEQKTPSSAQTVAFDADRLHLGLGVRSWQHGDKLRPFGLDGHVSVGDLFTSAKVPLLARSRWPVVVHGGEVVWVVGLRRGDQAPVTRATRRIAWLEWVGAIPRRA